MYGPHICGDAIDIFGNHILTGSYRSKDVLQLWDIKMRKLFKTIEWEGIQRAGGEAAFLYAAQFSKPHGDLIIAGGAGRNEVKIFDNMNDHRLVGTISDIPKACLGADFSNKGSMFAFGCADGCLRVMNCVLSEPSEDFTEYKAIESQSALSIQSQAEEKIL